MRMPTHHPHDASKVPHRPGAQPATKVTTDFNANPAFKPPTPDYELADAGKQRIYEFPVMFVDGPGHPAWDLRPYTDFLAADESAAVTPEANPSLWRNASLNMNVGVYKVVENAVYQVRGLDLSNITFLEDPTLGSKKVVAVDPLVSEECAARAWEYYKYARGHDRVIAAVIYTHSHLDHYGGVRGLFPNGFPGDVLIYAPDGFVDHVVSENVYAGIAMARRATFMYGMEVPKAPDGQIDAGLGKTSSTGTTGFLAPSPNCTIDSTNAGKPMQVGPVTVIFQLTPNTEAPSEMNFYLPQTNALCMAENATPTLHNVYSLRGAQVRDAKAWSNYLNDTNATWGATATVMFSSHFWPRWPDSGGKTTTGITDFLAKQADMYGFIHDQTLQWANQGKTIIEVAEYLDSKLPASLAQEWYNRGYYGTMNHNVKAVYQRYLGFYDGNPANLHPLTPSAAGARYISTYGSPAAMLAVAQDLLKAAEVQDDYRFLAEFLSHLVFGDPSNVAARALQADVLEQLGYQAESGPWRNFYLAASDELRLPALPAPTVSELVKDDVVAAMPVRSLFDFMGMRLNADNVAGKYASMSFTINNGLTGDITFCVVRVRNSVVVCTTERPTERLQATYTIERQGLCELAQGERSPQQLRDEDHYLTVDYGDLTPINMIYENLVTIYGNWPISRPPTTS
jgi:alkyl sulfatase BDS1-like metallo-beta-lactamase superfamily hydrolase